MKDVRFIKLIIAMLGWLFASTILSGCVHQGISKLPIISPDWPKHQQDVEHFDKWQVFGKLAVKVPNDGGTVSLHWQQQGNDYQIDLSGPFGQGKMIIQSKDALVTLQQAGNHPQTAKTAEELIYRNTGWNIPVTQLAFWVRGLPAATMKTTHFEPNAQGLIGELQQAGWKITYANYVNVNTTNSTNVPETDSKETNSAIAMPDRIVAEYRDIRLTLVIREWKLESSISRPEL